MRSENAFALAMVLECVDPSNIFLSEDTANNIAFMILVLYLATPHDMKDTTGTLPSVRLSILGVKH